MSLQVVFLRPAEQDLKALKSYLIKNFGTQSWQASYALIKASVETLKTFVLGGKIIEELETLHLTQYRQVLSGRNRIVYEIRQATIYIHIICDTRKDMQSLLSKRLLRVS